MKFKLKFLIMAGILMGSIPNTLWAGHFGDATTGHPGRASATVPVLVEDVLNTLHNLGSNRVNNNNIIDGTNPTVEVCVFCHTPHGASASAPGAAPLWNRATGLVSGTYATYGSPNFDQGTAGQPKGVSLACLSCHDGTIALDALINAGGSGGFRSANTVPATAVTGGAIDKAGGSAMLQAGGADENAFDGNQRTDSGKNYEAMLGGAAPFPNLTITLSDDHPISFPIPATDPQFDDVVKTVSGNIKLLNRTSGSRTRFAPVDKRDALRTYPANGATDAPGDWIECASCHNPHTPRPLFLRLPSSATPYVTKGGGTIRVQDVLGTGSNTTLIADDPNAGSAVCISCHEK